MCVAVCQPCVQALAAAARDGGGRAIPAQPRSMTLMAGPIDTRINPTKVNELATGKPIEWFEQQPDRRACRCAIPARGRRVYPGFVQLTAFMAMNLERHVEGACRPLSTHLAKGDDEKADDDQGLLRRVFRRARPAGGVLSRDRRSGCSRSTAAARRARHGAAARVDPRAIRRTALLTVEGERDDICAVGQTVAAHDLCTGLRPYLQAPPPAARRRPLRRVQRQALGRARSIPSCATSSWRANEAALTRVRRTRGKC